MDEINGRDFSPKFLPFLGRVCACAEGRSEILQSPNAHCVFARFAIVQEIGWWKEACDTLHLTAVAVHRVLGGGVAFRSFDAHCQGKVPAGAAASNAEAIWIHCVFGGVMSNEPHRPVNVLLNFSDDEFWLRTVHYGKDG